MLIVMKPEAKTVPKPQVRLIVHVAHAGLLSERVLILPERKAA